MTEPKPATVRYVGLHTDGPVLVRTPDDRIVPVEPGEPFTTTAAHAKELCESASWEPANPKKGSD